MGSILILDFWGEKLQSACAMKITIDVDGSSSATVMAILESKRQKLETDLTAVRDQIVRLKKATENAAKATFGGVPEVSRTPSGRAASGTARRAIETYLTTVATPFGATQQEIMEATHTSKTTSFRVLQQLRKEHKVAWVNGIWVTNVLSDPLLEKSEGEQKRHS